MSTSYRLFVCSISAVCAVTVLSGCATGRKNMQPVSEQQKSEFFKKMDVVEQPALEADWADFVKQKYPNWRQHYWVDRGNWGNRGYIVGKPPTEVEPIVEAQMTPLPPAPPAIVESAPPKVETPQKPTKYVVQKGDSLWRIAGKVYHNPLQWPRIFRANRDKISNPNRIFVNQVLVIPQD
jgi:nucleoid-associated protein YgaU